MRRWLPVVNALLFIILLLAPVWGGNEAIAQEETPWLNLERLNEGIVTVGYTVGSDSKVRLMIAKGQERYTYTLRSDKHEESFPLQMGNGDYSISVLEQVSGNTYRIVRQHSVSLELDDSSVVYLNSIQNVNWSADGVAAETARELASGLTGELEMAKAIHAYIIGSIEYDVQLALNPTADYIPDPDRTLTELKDICYGYASLYAAMLRSVGIPAKLVMGQSLHVEVYHAWNEVLIDGHWTIVDTTVDAGWSNSGIMFEFEKNEAHYIAAKQY